VASFPYHPSSYGRWWYCPPRPCGREVGPTSYRPGRLRQYRQPSAHRLIHANHYAAKGSSAGHKRQWVTKVDHGLPHIGNVRSAISTRAVIYFGLRRSLPELPFRRGPSRCSEQDQQGSHWPVGHLLISQGRNAGASQLHPPRGRRSVPAGWNRPPRHKMARGKKSLDAATTRPATGSTTLRTTRRGMRVAVGDCLPWGANV
jgi:hypothetical protein